MISLKNSDSLKQAIDTFWLKNIGSKSKAKQVISLYYQRVEEANKQFSNFKEGWKTDPGMMYILFGRPLYYDRYIDSMTWYYSYDRSDPRETFQFDKPTIKHPSFPFDHYILTRNFFYDNIEYQQRERWLSGLILSGSI
ncbi:MAG: GWxTD domain-containing protein [Balneolaceae bacterium]|nr:GWxTD domain-containing protein [Balneolaceae bacterium]